MTVSEYDYLLDKALRDPGSPQLITELIRHLEREYEFTPEQAGAKILREYPELHHDVIIECLRKNGNCSCVIQLVKSVS